MKVGLFRPITLWPFPERRIAELAGQAKAMIIPEMNLGQMILEVERIVKGACDLHGIGRVDGEPITPSQIMEKIKEVC
jgi:2-oxoglutarate ferredoxin oxidoreductase subunit alpha